MTIRPRALFGRKLNDIEELREATARAKQTGQRGSLYEVTKVVSLEGDDFKAFSEDFFNEQPGVPCISRSSYQFFCCMLLLCPWTHDEDPSPSVWHLNRSRPEAPGRIGILPASSKEWALNPPRVHRYRGYKSALPPASRRTEVPGWTPHAAEQAK